MIVEIFSREKKPSGLQDLTKESGPTVNRHKHCSEDHGINTE